MPQHLVVSDRLLPLPGLQAMGQVVNGKSNMAWHLVEALPFDDGLAFVLQPFAQFLLTPAESLPEPLELRTRHEG